MTNTIRQGKEEEKMKKLLVCYFSATGTTKNVAEKISKLLNGSLFEIEPSLKYSPKDLDWMNKKSRSSIEMADDQSRPEILNTVKDIEDYQKVIIGFPVWWYREPSIIDTFIEENNLEGKEIYLFVTSGGSGVEECLVSLKKKYPHLNFISGKRLNSSINESDILSWIK